LLTDVHDIEGIARVGHRQESPGSNACVPCAHPERVQRYPEEPRDRVLDRADRVPSLPEFEEGVLHELLRVVRTPGDEVQGSIQSVVLIEEELFEGQRPHGGLWFPAELD